MLLIVRSLQNYQYIFKSLKINLLRHFDKPVCQMAIRQAQCIVLRL